METDPGNGKGNDYAMARYSIDRFGRFSSADLLQGSTLDPRSLNRYNYVEDPINLTDPSGLCPIWGPIKEPDKSSPTGYSWRCWVTKFVGLGLFQEVIMIDYNGCGEGGGCIYPPRFPSRFLLASAAVMVAVAAEGNVDPENEEGLLEPRA